MIEKNHTMKSVDIFFLSYFSLSVKATNGSLDSGTNVSNDDDIG